MDIFVAEFMGTLILVLLGDGVVANATLERSKGKDSGWIVITAGWGFAVAMGVYVADWASGAHINPAVTLGKAVIGAVPVSQIPLYLAGQFLGALAGAVLVWLAYLPHWSQTKDETAKLGVFATVPAIRNTAGNVICELIGTAVLVFGVLGIMSDNNEIGSGVGPMAVGMLVFSIGLSLGGPTGYAINPARDFAPRLAHAVLPIPGKGPSDWGYAWVPIVGPILGGILGALLYNLTMSGLTPLVTS
jgi:glycerol uptake facilitator protein